MCGGYLMYEFLFILTPPYSDSMGVVVEAKSYQEATEVMRDNFLGEFWHGAYPGEYRDLKFHLESPREFWHHL
jgi:hypothetical protein